ncbi:MAG: hypothetical protein M1817_006748 [Caeruleum heppii]|nr:MAG: hypothetical protein M1817_006748 [Caeruleum heppii]
MADDLSFGHVFSFKPDYHYDPRDSAKIQGHRQTLGNDLFLDKLFGVLHIEEGKKLYPPQSNHDLRRLHQNITSSGAPQHYIQSVLYYLLLDCSRRHHNVAEHFAARQYLPEKYKAYIRGLWHMDHLQFHAALEDLTDPSLLPTFPDEILIALARHAAHGDFSLALAYYHTVSPALITSQALDTLFSALCAASVTEAFFFARGQAETIHRHLFEQLISHVLGSSRSHSVELVNLPLTEEEETLFENYLSKGEGRQLTGAKDTVLMRKMATGHFAEVLEEKRGPSGKRIEGLNWDTLRAGLASGLGPRRAINDKCKFEHPPKGGAFQTPNRFTAIQGSHDGNTSTGSFGGPPTARTLPRWFNSFSINKDAIVIDLSKERPQWILSAYGPGREPPTQLFGGPVRERSFEEMRVRHYLAVAANNPQEAITEAQGLVTQAEQQIQTVLNDVDGAVNFIVDAEKTHPNRRDNCLNPNAAATPPGLTSNPLVQGNSTAPIPANPFAAARPPTIAINQSAGAFGQPAQGTASTGAFGQAVQPTTSAGAFGQPSQLGGGSSAFGKPSALGPAPPTFGHPNPLGGASSFGQPAQMGKGPVFGQPTQAAQPGSVFGGNKPGLTFGQPSQPATNAFSGAPQQPAPSTFGQPTPFGQATQPAQSIAPNPFAAAAPSTESSGVFGAPSAPAANPFAAATTPSALPNPFSQAATAGQPVSAPPSQPSANPFAAASQPSSNAFARLPSSAPSLSGPTPIVNGTGNAGAMAPSSGVSHSDPSIYSTRDGANRLLTWKSQPVTYVDGEPCYKRSDNGHWEKIWFPNGPPGFSADTELVAEMYDEQTKEAYLFLRDHGTFKNGLMPFLPPRREWCSWDF